MAPKIPANARNDVAIYRYQSGSLIDEVYLVKNASGGVRAYLHAKSDATADQLSTITTGISANNWKGIPFSASGLPYLEVRGFKTPNDLIALLQTNGWAKGDANITQQESDIITRKERLRNLTLRLTGYAYNFGDLCYMIYAVMGLKGQKELHRQGKPSDIGAEKLNVGAGIGYAMGGTALSLFGSRDQSQAEIDSATQKVKDYLAKEGVHATPDSTIDYMLEDKNHSFGHRFRKFVSRYPSEILNTIYIGVGGLIAAHAYRNWKVTGKPGDLIDVGLGAVTTTSALLGITVKEKKPIAGEPKKHGLARAWQWIEEKPLRATGIGYFIATMFHATSTIKGYRAGDPAIREEIKFRGGFVAANVFAEALMFTSSKGHGQGVVMDDSIEKTVCAAAADIIARQPEEKQQALVNQLAGYLASPGQFGSKADKIASEMRQQLAAIKTTPWATHAAKLAADEPAIASADPAASLESQTPTSQVTEATAIAKAPAEDVQTVPENWQEHAAQLKAAPSEASLSHI